ncbi:MAG: carbohydrate kinase [Clostridium sp.]|nr:carbohydrate kinase [Clostridium sp.]
MEEKYMLAYDCGTTAVKTVVIRMDGTVIGESRADNPLIQMNPGWAEQDPEVLWERICRTTKDVIKKHRISPQNIAGLVFVAHWKNIIPVSKEGQVLHNSIIWMDSRAARQAARLNEAAGCFVGTGQEYWPRLMWLKETKPEIWDKADKIMGLNTYFKWRATGQFVTEPSDDFIHAYNPAMQEYYNRVLAAAGLKEDVSKFPPVRPAAREVGKTTPQAAAEMGLAPGISVFGGFGDLPAITVGTGCCQKDMAHIYFGTSSWLVNIMEERRENYAPQYFTFNQEFEGALFALQTGCFAFDWAVSQFYHEERNILGNDIFEFVDKQLEEIPAGSGDLIATHWLTGELPPLAKNAKALFLNITSSHDRRHMVHAIMESICYTHRSYMETYEKKTGKKLDSIRVVGGGAGSDMWMQMLADVLQIKVEVPESPRYTGAIGAYYCAMVGLGMIENYDAIYKAVRIEKTFLPRKENAQIYEKVYNVYGKLFPALKDLYSEINGVY